MKIATYNRPRHSFLPELVLVRRGYRGNFRYPITMAGKEPAGTVRVKAAEITAQESGRLEARRACGHTHLMVGMSP